MLREYLDDMQRSLYSLLQNSNGSQTLTLLPLAFEELRFLSHDLASEIAEFVLGPGPEAGHLADHLQRVSDPSSELKNNFVSLGPSNDSYYEADRQTSLPVRITRKNRKVFMADWEIQLARMYTPVHEYLMGELKQGRGKVALKTWLQFPKTYLNSWLFGLKEVRENLPLTRRLRLRRSGHQLVISSFIWLTRFYLKLVVAKLIRRDFRPTGRHDRVHPPQNQPGAGAE